MTKQAHITPLGQVTIPRSVMKSLGICGGNDILVEVENGRLVLRKMEKTNLDNKRNQIYKVG